MMQVRVRIDRGPVIKGNGDLPRCRGAQSEVTPPLTRNGRGQGRTHRLHPARSAAPEQR